MIQKLLMFVYICLERYKHEIMLFWRIFLLGYLRLAYTAIKDVEIGCKKYIVYIRETVLFCSGIKQSTLHRNPRYTNANNSSNIY